MRARIVIISLMGLLALSPVRGQQSAPGGGAPESGTVRLAQFQPGISPLGSNVGLPPGQSFRLAMYCGDLFASSPTDRVAFTASGSDARVVLASGQEVPLGKALEAGLLVARGRGPGDPPHPAGGQWFDLYLTNHSGQPVHLSMPAGTLLVPAGQAAPEVRPTIRRLFAAARVRRLLGSPTLANAVWATRGFTREDVEQTTMTLVLDEAAEQVQALLAAADLGYQFDRGRGEYAKLYEQRHTALAEAVALKGAALLPSGKSIQAEILADDSGQALVRLEPSKGAGPLYYAARVTERRSDRLTVELLHLKTGRPLEAARGPLLVRLSSQVTRR